MGTETSSDRADISFLDTLGVKLKNPLMGTETPLHYSDYQTHHKKYC